MNRAKKTAKNTAWVLLAITLSLSVGCKTKQGSLEKKGRPDKVVDGTLDGEGTATVNGWAVAKDTENPVSVEISFFHNDNKWVNLGSVFANLPRTDVQEANGYKLNSGFEMPVPKSVVVDGVEVPLLDGKVRKFRALAKTITGKLIELNRSPREYTLKK